jgi:hypothetical protein
MSNAAQGGNSTAFASAAEKLQAVALDVRREMFKTYADLPEGHLTKYFNTPRIQIQNPRSSVGSAPVNSTFSLWDAVMMFSERAADASQIDPRDLTNSTLWQHSLDSRVLSLRFVQANAYPSIVGAVDGAVAVLAAIVNDDFLEHATAVSISAFAVAAPAVIALAALTLHGIARVWPHVNSGGMMTAVATLLPRATAGKLGRHYDDIYRRLTELQSDDCAIAGGGADLFSSSANQVASSPFKKRAAYLKTGGGSASERPTVEQPVMTLLAGAERTKQVEEQNVAIAAGASRRQRLNLEDREVEEFQLGEGEDSLLDREGAAPSPVAADGIGSPIVMPSLPGLVIDIGHDDGIDSPRHDQFAVPKSNPPARSENSSTATRVAPPAGKAIAFAPVAMVRRMSSVISTTGGVKQRGDSLIFVAHLQDSDRAREVLETTQRAVISSDKGFRREAAGFRF